MNEALTLLKKKGYKILFYKCRIAFLYTWKKWQLYKLYNKVETANKLSLILILFIRKAL